MIDKTKVQPSVTPIPNPEPEICRECGKPAMFEMKIELCLLYDFPVGRYSFYFCKDCCVMQSQVMRFTQDKPCNPPGVHFDDGPGTARFGGPSE